jgi:phosphoserine phosphatase
MTTSSPDAAQFSGLILLTGEDKPGLAHALFEALSPFSVGVMDLDQIVIKDRLILTVQISLNPVHQSAIEEDLNSLATNLEIDIAAVFSTSTPPAKKPESFSLKISSAKLHPKHLMQTTAALFEAGGNIENFSRTSIDPIEVLIEVSGLSPDQIATVLAKVETGSDFSLTIGK